MRTKSPVMFLVGMLLFATSLSAAEMRTWTRKNGKEFQAEFVKMEKDQEGHNIVTLRKPNGNEVTVRLGSLSEDDRKYARRQAKGITPLEAVAQTSVSNVLDQAPAAPGQQREWLRGRLLKDAELCGIFDGDTTTKVLATLRSLSDDQLALLCQYYLLVRSKTEQDAYLYSLQQQGCTTDQINAAKAAIADLLGEMQSQADTCYGRIRTLGAPVQYLAQIEYASIPGWCVSTQCCVPGWYYANGGFVGPCYNPGYCGVYAAPVYRSYYDTKSRFYRAYHSIGERVYWSHTAQIAQRSAKYLHEHDYHRALAHDRLLGGPSRLRQTGQHDAPVPHALARGQAVENTQQGKAAVHAEHTQPAGRVEHGKAATKPEHSKPAPKPASASKSAAKPKESKLAAKPEHAKPVEHAEHNKGATKPERSKPATQMASASKPSSSATAEHIRPAAKQGSANNPTAKPEHAKAATKSAPPNKPATKEEKKK